ncbi:hypothetical protein D9756_006282 [Leucocoprinus leucothites]|uniref:Uncharacterized protein n=1 Tax=Leucocoprinus leucothites TaxID=201217 RepID=A0A8H5FXE1_9AGAR|nr:hypothetical protein D9756_006282 [Leucoagaricus leucothites]
MASPPDPLPVNAPLILGPLMVGIVLNWFFYGILTMQYLMYLNNDREDKKWLRTTVHFMFLLDTIQSIMMMDDLFFWFVHNFNDYSVAAFEFHLITVDGLFLDALIMFIAQLVYCWRLRELGKWTILPAASALLSLISCVSGMFIGIKMMYLDSTSARKYTPVEDVWLLASAITDIIIASSMTYLLHPVFAAYEVSKRISFHAEKYDDSVETNGHVNTGDRCYHSCYRDRALYLHHYTGTSRICKAFLLIMSIPY